MPIIQRSALVPFASSDIYKLINDIERYPEFLPGCHRAETLEMTSETITARLHVSKSGIKQTFVTKNTLVENQQVTMSLVEGPFQYLSGIWRLQTLDTEACKIEFELEFEFSNKLIGVAFNKVFRELAESMLQSFIDRAKQQLRT